MSIGTAIVLVTLELETANLAGFIVGSVGGESVCMLFLPRAIFFPVESLRVVYY